MGRMDDTRPPFVGRVDELRLLTEQVRATATAWGGVILVTGAAGIGKTRLVEETLARFAGRIRCIDGASILADALRAPSPSVGLIRLKMRLRKSFAASSSSPTAVVFEGLDENDSAAQALFAGWDGFTPNANERGIVIFCLRTQGDVRFGVNPPLVSSLHRASLHVDLNPLSSADARILARFTHSPAGVRSRSEGARIERLGEGNPRILLTLLRGDADARTFLAGEESILKELDVASRRFVAVGAIAGETFEVSRVARVAQLPVGRALELAQVLLERNIARVEPASPDVLAFSRPLLRELVLSEVPSTARRAWHASVLDDIGNDPERVRDRAYHALFAGKRQALQLAREAADSAFRRGDFADAAEWYDAALQRASDSDWPGIARRRAFALCRAGSGAEALAAVEECIDEDLDTEDESALTLYLAMWQNWVQCNAARARSLACELESLALPPNDPLAPRVHLSLARFSIDERNAKGAATFLGKVAIRTVRHDAGLAASYYMIRARIRAAVGTQAAAHADLQRALRAITRSEDARASAVAGNDAMAFAIDHGYLDAASGESLRVREHAVRSHAADVAAISALNQAELALLTGDLEASRRHVFDALGRASDSMLVRMASSIGVRTGLLLDDQTLVRICHDDEALEAAFRSDRPDAIACVSGSVAQLIAARGETRAAAAMLHRALLRIHELNGCFWFPVVVAQIGSRRDLDHARTLLTNRDGERAGLVHAMLLLFDAIVSRREKHWREAARSGVAATAAFASLGAPYFEALAHEAAGDNERAVEIFERIGDVRDARLVAARRVARRRGETSLTARERDVAALAAQGLRTRAIADVLAISEKTVQHHLQRVYAKLGVHSRWQLSSEDLTPSNRAGQNISA
jgi:DNA-binding CsgD family transcriptional regulator